MPKRESANTNAFRDRRRIRAKELLGGVCVQCGTSDELEFDHINPDTKSFTISNHWNKKWEDMVEELKKCQLLCKEHHKEKSMRDGDLGSVEHGGGITGKKSCFCELCGPLKKEYMRLYHLARKDGPKV